MGIYPSDFADVFSDILKEYDVSCYKIHQYTHLDQGYLSRLRNGRRINPSPETIVKIALALVHNNNKIKISGINRLFQAVGRSIYTNNHY